MKKFPVIEVGAIVVMFTMAGTNFYSYFTEGASAGSTLPLESPTLDEVNAVRTAQGREAVDSLSWIDENGENVYKVRQREFDAIGAEAYSEKHADSIADQ